MGRWSGMWLGGVCITWVASFNRDKNQANNVLLKQPSRCKVVDLCNKYKRFCKKQLVQAAQLAPNCAHILTQTPLCATGAPKLLPRHNVMH